MLNKNLATGIDIEKCNCSMFKFPFSEKSNFTSNIILEIIHSDLCKPMQTATPRGKIYIAAFVHRYIFIEGYIRNAEYH